MNSREVRETEWRIVIHQIFGIHGERYLIETLTVKANIMI